MTAPDRSSRLSLAFSCLGHLYSHLFAPIFFVVALTLERELGRTHGEVVTLVLIANVLYGVAAPLAGWLGDRWRMTAMMGLFFLGTGAGMVLTGLAESAAGIAVALAVTGLFASIYHPVGIAWLVRNAAARGMALGINGVFGAVGPAVAVLSAGLLTDLYGWRAAFLVPGVVVLLTGGVFWWMVAHRAIVDTRVDRRAEVPVPRGDALRAGAVLAVTMLCTGLIYQATQPALPKLFSDRLSAVVDGGVLGISMLVSLVYLVSGGLQILAGHLADRLPLKLLYVTCFALQVPLMLMAAGLGGGALVLVAMMMVSVNAGALPAENSLVARFAPSQRRGLAFGLKFILAFGVSAVGIRMEGAIYDATGGFWWLFATLAAIAAVGAAAAMLLPSERRIDALVAAE